MEEGGEEGEGGGGGHRLVRARCLVSVETESVGGRKKKPIISFLLKTRTGCWSSEDAVSVPAPEQHSVIHISGTAWLFITGCRCFIKKCLSLFSFIYRASCSDDIYRV